ncbi:leucine-rich protein, related [Neospora caninum Liverpool]|uniref:Dynein regulatory complex subunit 3 n=1 Tax=Neospora caninum (strain Liverpool) TaxID=572307 RepID=F0VAJ9_NEOCL|nr:leucine-rich protein, related [Neospora caninum Liverpool]CBZ50688.1 leucine-rich protein, related [Neospora caninum Liverpool]CEL65299.1 TPA: Leucine-rich protein, related [Neospora caninum Liverpool]|eukprot:XP_003880721.1 leucine-rich protein, related [Neospora caninum Liverpool]
MSSSRGARGRIPRPPSSRASTAGAGAEITLFSDELFSRPQWATALSGASAPRGNPARQKSDIAEPQVIDEEVLKNGVVADGSQGTEEPTEPKDFATVQSLSLSYKNIMFIENLETFTGLTTLRLDNNVIETIENLSHLVNLVWLDLSFNNISEISGLSNLANLTDLSLYSNKISKIGTGLEGCPKLNVLSLGKNAILDLSEIHNLRRHPNLQCLNLDGNPLCKAENYTPYILAFLPKLRYLDYQLIDRRKIVAVQESVQPEELTDMKKQESVEAALAEQRKKRAKTTEHLAANFCAFLDDVANRFFGESVIPAPVTVLKDFPLLRDAFLEKLEILTTNLRQTFEQQNRRRRQRVAAYEEAVQRAVLESEGEARTLLRQMQSRKKKVEKELERYFDERREILDRISVTNAQPTKFLLTSISPGQNDDSTRLACDEDFQRLVNSRAPQLYAAVANFVGDVDKLRFHLMGCEATLQESLEESVDTLEAAVDSTMKQLLDRGTDFFRNVEEAEKTFSSSLTELATAELEAFPAVMDEETNDLRVKYLGKKDEVLNACSALLEVHLQLLMFMEDSMQTGMSAWQRHYFENERQSQYERHRRHIEEIHRATEDLTAKVLHYQKRLSRDREDTRRSAGGTESGEDAPVASHLGKDEKASDAAESDSHSESETES